MNVFNELNVREELKVAIESVVTKYVDAANVSKVMNEFKEALLEDEDNVLNVYATLTVAIENNVTTEK